MTSTIAPVWFTRFAQMKDAWQRNELVASYKSERPSGGSESRSGFTGLGTPASQSGASVVALGTRASIYALPLPITTASSRSPRAPGDFAVVAHRFPAHPKRSPAWGCIQGRENRRGEHTEPRKRTPVIGARIQLDRGGRSMMLPRNPLDSLFFTKIGYLWGKQSCSEIRPHNQR